MKLNQELVKYIHTKIIPMYKKHDRAHDEEHAKEVIDASFLIAHLVKQYIDLNILIASAALHDVGIRVNREKHHEHSARIIRHLRIELGKAGREKILSLGTREYNMNILLNYLEDNML